MQKSGVSTMSNHSKPSKTTLDTMAFGTTSAAFCISSHLWIAPSAPKKACTLPSSPTEKESLHNQIRARCFHALTKAGKPTRVIGRSRRGYVACNASIDLTNHNMASRFIKRRSCSDTIRSCFLFILWDSASSDIDPASHERLRNLLGFVYQT